MLYLIDGRNIYNILGLQNELLKYCFFPLITWTIYISQDFADTMKSKQNAKNQVDVKANKLTAVI